jgi:hypothetical protein
MPEDDNLPGEARLQRIDRMERGNLLADPPPARPLPGERGVGDHRRQVGQHGVELIVADWIGRRGDRGDGVGGFGFDERHDEAPGESGLVVKVRYTNTNADTS